MQARDGKSARHEERARGRAARWRISSGWVVGKWVRWRVARGRPSAGAVAEPTDLVVGLLSHQHVAAATDEEEEPVVRLLALLDQVSTGLDVRQPHAVRQLLANLRRELVEEPKLLDVVLRDEHLHVVAHGRLLGECLAQRFADEERIMLLALAVASR